MSLQYLSIGCSFTSFAKLFLSNLDMICENKLKFTIVESFVVMQLKDNLRYFKTFSFFIWSAIEFCCKVLFVHQKKIFYLYKRNNLKMNSKLITLTILILGFCSNLKAANADLFSYDENNIDKQFAFINSIEKSFEKNQIEALIEYKKLTSSNSNISSNIYPYDYFGCNFGYVIGTMFSVAIVASYWLFLYYFI